MEIRVLRYFLEIAREGNMSRAAERLHVTQPTLSKQMKDLEEEKPSKTEKKEKTSAQIEPKKNEKMEREDKILIKKARDHFDASQEAQKKGDWALYGEELKKLETTLTELENLR